MKRLPLSRLDGLFAAIAAEKPLYIPADQGGVARFLRWEPGMALTEDLNTARSAKDLFFPQVENLADFRVTGREIEIHEVQNPAEPFVLFGVRACDVRSFEILDRVFLQEPVDTFYGGPAEKRHHRLPRLRRAGGNVLLHRLFHRPRGPRRRRERLDDGGRPLLSANTERARPAPLPRLPFGGGRRRGRGKGPGRHP